MNWKLESEIDYNLLSEFGNAVTKIADDYFSDSLKFVEMNFVFHRTNFQGTNNFYSGIIDDGENQALVCISPIIIQAIPIAMEFHGDGTFGITPCKPRRIRQVLTFSVVIYKIVSVV